MRYNSAYEGAVSAEVYDIQYPNKDYAREADWVNELVRKYGNPNSSSLLDVGCGTGRHLEFFARSFSGTAGIDSSEAQLTRAENRVSAWVNLYRADMENFDLGAKFDVVVCLFAAIAHLDTQDKLQRGMSAMARHVAPNGLLLVEPWLTPDEFTIGGDLRTMQVETPAGATLWRMSVMNASTPGEGPVTLDMHFLYGRRAGDAHKIDTFAERHSLGLFETDTYKQAMLASDFETAWSEQPPENLSSIRPLVIGRMAVAQPD